MGDERQPKARPSDPAHATIPPELREYVGKRQRPVVERRGEDAAQGAVFNALMVSASEQAEAEAKAEAKASAKIITCVDRAVRAVVWPPSSRRDSFATDF